MLNVAEDEYFSGVSLSIAIICQTININKNPSIDSTVKSDLNGHSK